MNRIASLFTMEDDPGPSAPGAESPRTNIDLEQIRFVTQTLQECYAVGKFYEDIFCGNEPLAPRLIEPINPELEKILLKLFSGPPVCLDECANPVPQSQDPVQWSEILRQKMKASDFEVQPNGTYRCRAQGMFLEVSEDNYHIILSGLPQRMVMPLSEAERERKVVYKARDHFSECLVTINKFSRVLHDLLGNLEVRIDRLVHKSEDETAQLDIPSSSNPPERPRSILELGAREIGGEQCLDGPSSGMQVSDSDSTGSDIAFRPQREVRSESQPRKTGRKLPRRLLASNLISKKLGSLNSTRYKSRGMRITKAAKTPKRLYERKSPNLPYTEQETAEGYEFAQSLMDQEVSANKILHAYESTFGIRRTMQALKIKFKVQEPKNSFKAQKPKHKVKRTGQVNVPYSSQEVAEGFDFLKSLVDQKADAKTILTAYDSKFGARRTCTALYARYTIPELNPDRAYTEQEITEGYDFLKNMIEKGADANTIVNAYETKFGIHRRYLGLLSKFKLRNLNPPKETSSPQYSDREFAEARTFVMSLIQQGADEDTIETAYEQKFGAHRTYLAIRSKFGLPYSLNGVKRENQEDSMPQLDSDDSDF